MLAKKRDLIFKAIYLFLFSLFVLTVNTSCLMNKNPMQWTEQKNIVETYKTKYTEEKEDIKTTGELSSPQSTEISSEIKGKIIYLNIPEGNEIKKGETIARIEDSTNQAEIKIAKARLENAKEDFRRMETLLKEGAISKQTFDNSNEKLRALEGEYERSLSMKEKTVISAPFNGILSIKDVSLGSVISPGDKIVRLSQINPLNLIFTVPEKYISSIKTGQNAYFSLENDPNNYSAQVSVIDPYIDPASRAIKILATIQNPSNVLLPGRFVKIKLESGKSKKVIVVPQEAIIHESGKTKVYLVSDLNKVFEKEISVSNWSRGYAYVEDGLTENELVVTAGHQKIKSGDEVEVAKYKKIKNKNLDHLQKTI